MNRRAFFLGLSSIAGGLSRWAWCAPKPSAASISKIEERVGGRIGVYALDTLTGKAIEYRSDERFAMCSTFKWLLAAQLLANVDVGNCRLQDTVEYGRSDLLDYAPITSKHVEQGRLTLAQLAEAAVTVSDNTAANLLLTRLGGPKSLTTFARKLGDPVTRLDRVEPELNQNILSDPRDTTTPRGMVASLRGAFVGGVLSEASRSHLLGWLVACETGRNRLRAGMPVKWLVGDKTGSGRNNAVNDVAVALPPNRPPILVAVYMSESPAPLEALNKAHAEVGRIVTTTFGYTNDA